MIHVYVPAGWYGSGARRMLCQQRLNAHLSSDYRQHKSYFEVTSSVGSVGPQSTVEVRGLRFVCTTDTVDDRTPLYASAELLLRRAIHHYFFRG